MRTSRRLDILPKPRFTDNRFLCISWVWQSGRVTHVVYFLVFDAKMAGSWKKIRGSLTVENMRSVVFNPENSMLLMVALFVMEIFVNVWVIQNIKCKLDV